MLSRKLKMYRERAGLSVNELAEMLGTARQTIYKYETGIISNIPYERITQLASALGVQVSELVGEQNDSAKYEEFSYGEESASGNAVFGAKRIPMLGEIACGEPRFASEEHDGYAIVSDNLSVDFCLRANGDSMIGARIFDGDIVYIRKQESVDNGEIAAVIIDDEATLKRVYYYPEEEKLVLSPENPKYPPLVYMGEELSLIKILGKAVAFQSCVI